MFTFYMIMLLQFIIIYNINFVTFLEFKTNKNWGGKVLTHPKQSLDKVQNYDSDVTELTTLSKFYVHLCNDLFL